MSTIELVAAFPTVDRAQAFATRIQEPGWWATSVERKGRTVTFKVTPPTVGPSTSPGEVFLDYLETVGHFGSDQSRKATLYAEVDGRVLGPRKAPASY